MMMFKAIRPNYFSVYYRVKEIISLYNLNSIPIRLDVIIKRTKNLKLCSYSELCKSGNCTIEEVIDFLGSELGAYTCTKDRSKCVIYYNDTKNNIGLDRFTIAHELGHHFLEHYKYQTDGDVLLRGLSKPNYDAIEKEANCFARNLLSPVYLINSIGLRPNDTDKIKDIFNISFSAAKIRSKSYKLDLRWRIQGFQTFFDTQFSKSIKILTKLGQCLVCGYYYSKVVSNYCPICGNDHWHNIILRMGGLKHMFYPGIETDQNGKAKKCPTCSSEQLELGEYCPICGTHIVNTCMNCGSVQQGYARYCVHCGEKTSFFDTGLLDDWKNIKNSVLNPKELPSSFNSFDLDGFSDLVEGQDIQNGVENDDLPF